MKILKLSADSLSAINKGDDLCAFKLINLLVLQVSHMTVARGQQKVYFSAICRHFHHFYHKLVADFDEEFNVFNENDTFSDRESGDSDPKRIR